MKSEKIDFVILMLLVFAISYMHALRIEENNAGAWKKFSRQKVLQQKVQSATPPGSLTGIMGK